MTIGKTATADRMTLENHFAVTIDKKLTSNTVTIRDRDTMKAGRIR